VIKDHEKKLSCVEENISDNIDVYVAPYTMKWIYMGYAPG